MNKYINDRIENMIFSKLSNKKMMIKHYFKHRHTGLAGIDNEMVCGLVSASIRDYRVWFELSKRACSFTGYSSC